jgi:hypothetical protein
MRKSLLCCGVGGGRKSVGTAPPTADDVAKAYLVSVETSPHEKVAFERLAGAAHKGLASLLFLFSRILAQHKHGGAWHDTIRDDAAPTVLPKGTALALRTTITLLKI